MTGLRGTRPASVPAAHGQNGSGLLRVLLLGPRGWRRWWTALVKGVDHDAILARSEEDGTFSFNYAFMLAIAAGIATIGLLLNSPAVIIGAMLISPLMGPIVSTGFAVATFDAVLGKRSAQTLFMGALAAVSFAAAIALLSPVKELTSEILARTRPNLFDLAVAILSGTAGGYAMIRGRGGAIVGVAIATALMPPLAVVGYGLATWQWLVVRGALLLFVTNMVAIALAVAAIAVWYGFGQGQLRKRFAAQAVISLLVLAPLCVPLFYSLKGIAWESRVHHTVRNVFNSSTPGIEQNQLAQLNVHFGDSRSPAIDAIVVSKKPQPGLEAKVRGELEKRLGVPVTLRLTQLQADDPDLISARVKQELITEKPVDRDVEIAARIRDEIPFPLSAVEVNTEKQTAVVVPKAQDDVSLGGWKNIANQLDVRHPGWHITLVPPPGSLPAITFDSGSATLNTVAEQKLAVVAWALKQWGLQNVELAGQASSEGSGQKALALRRAKSAAEWLEANGISSRQMVLYPAPGQRKQERERGEAIFRSVTISLPVEQHTPTRFTAPGSQS